MKTKIPFLNVPRRFALRLAVTLFVVIALASSVWLFSAAAQRADSFKAQGNASKGLTFEKERREEEQEKYVREHSDPSGQVRPEAYVEGIEHVRHMKVAPYIGAKPIGETTPTPTK